MGVIEDLVNQFKNCFGTEPDLVVRAPGRVDLIGTHTDYNDGWVLPAAIDRYAWVAAKKLESREIQIKALEFSTTCFSLENLDSKTSTGGKQLEGWEVYAAGVAWSLQEMEVEVPGCQILISSQVPIGVGLSSSAAVEVAYATALTKLIPVEVDRMQLALACQKAENSYVGVSSGLMDQFSSLFGQEGKALAFDCRNRLWEPVPLSPKIKLVVADTCTKRTLTTSKYNERYSECQEAVQALQSVLPGIKTLRDVSQEQFEQHKELIPEPARWRAKHVIDEISRVQEASEALKKGEIEALGNLMDASHQSSRDLFEASSFELDAMWEASKDHPGRLGGRFVGAGWGGCTVFLVLTESAEDFCEYLSQRYEKATGIKPQVFLLNAAEGANQVA